MHGENPGRMAPLTAFTSSNELIFIKHKSPAIRKPRGIVLGVCSEYLIF